MSVVVSHPGIFQHAQQGARAFHERGELAAFVTGLVLNDDGLVKRFGEACLPPDLAARLGRELRRRAVTEVPADRVISYPWLDGFRTVLSRYSSNPVLADAVWDVMSRKFDGTVARRHLRGARIVYAFEYTAMHTFERARAEGIATVLGMPSLDSSEFEAIKNREEAQFPELKTRYHDYFARRFSARYERRKAEISLADLVVTNSELTRRSHIRAGADPTKIVSVPLAAPPPAAMIQRPDRPRDDALVVIWAGNFSVGKGAHYFLSAWRALRAGSKARARVHGAMMLPDRVLLPLPDNLELAGSVPQQDLFVAFARADVLAFPTLSDGFGAVVLEAFSHALPVITTESAGAAEFVEHGKNGLIVPAADSQALTDALQWCLDNRDALRQMRFAALDTARRWQWQDYRRKLVTTITGALSLASQRADSRLPQPDPALSG